MGDIVQLKPCANAAQGLRNIADMIESGELEDMATVVIGANVFMLGEFDDCRAAEQAVFSLNVGIHALMNPIFEGEL